MRVGMGLGVVSIAIGLALMLARERMCRTSCWAESLLSLFLPEEYQPLASGILWVLAGVVIIAWAIRRRPRS